MKLTAPRLARIRSFYSKDGQFAQFMFLNKAGQNFSFTVPFSEMGALITAFRKLARDMGERLANRGKETEAQIAEGMSSASLVVGLAVGSDLETGEALVWFETAEGGAMAFRVSEELRQELHIALSSRRERASKAAE